MKCYIYLDVLMYVPIVYGFLPEIKVFVFVYSYSFLQNVFTTGRVCFNLIANVLTIRFKDDFLCI